MPEKYCSNINLVNYVTNFEAPITDYDIGVSGKINLRVNKNHLLSTFKSKPLALCLANNHIVDYGATGFFDTINNLEIENISYFGAGYKSNNCNNPLIVNLANVKVALLAYVCKSTSPVVADGEMPGVELIDLEKVKQDIKLSKVNGAERIVVSFHWGAEHISKPKLEDILMARSVIDSGADLIIGHHAHCIQSHEKYNNKYIFYGLGNCIFPDFETDAYFNSKTGLPKRKFKLTQKYSNKTSLLVKYNPQTNTVMVDRLLFSNKKLIVHKSGIALRNKKINIKNYKKIFQFVYFIGKAKHAFHNWLQSPKLPRYRHLVALIDVAKSTEHK